MAHAWNTVAGQCPPHSATFGIVTDARLSRYTTNCSYRLPLGAGAASSVTPRRNPYYRVGWSRRRAGIGDRASVDGVAQSAPGGTPISSRVFPGRAIAASRPAALYFLATAPTRPARRVSGGGGGRGRRGSHLEGGGTTRVCCRHPAAVSVMRQGIG